MGAVRGRLPQGMRVADPAAIGSPRARFVAVETRNGAPFRAYVHWSRRPAEAPERWALVLAAVALARTVAALESGAADCEAWQDQAA